MANNQKTRTLYRELRGALLAKDTPTAFRVLRSIVEIDPQDAYAQEQLKETGEKFCHAHAAELQEAVSRQDVSVVARLVADLRNWAEEEWLSAHVPAYARAVSMTGSREQTPAISAGTPPAAAPAASTRAAKNSANPQTRNLYRELRETVVARQHEKSFDILNRIIELNPQDSGAREQRAETGRWLCDANAGEIAAVLSTQDKTATRQVVERFRSWADEAYLVSHVPSYAQAAQVADIMKRAELNRELEAMFARFEGMDEVQARHNLEGEISRYAVNNGVELSERQQGILNDMREEWNALCLSRERQQQLDEAEERLAVIRENFRTAERTDAAHTAYAADLQKMREELSAKEMFPELEVLYARVVKYQENARRRWRARLRQKWLRRSAAVVTTCALILMGGTAVYLYATVDKHTGYIYDALKAKDDGYLQQVVSSGSWTLVDGYRKVSKEYELAYQRARDWVNERSRQLACFREAIKKVEQESVELDMQRMMAAVGAWSEAAGMAADLQNNYGYTPSRSELAVLDAYKVALSQRRGVIMAAFMECPAGMTYEEMVSRNKWFSIMSVHLDITVEEKAKYHQNLNANVQARLLHRERHPWHISQEELDEGLRVFDTFGAELELDVSIRECLERLKAQAHHYEQRQKRLISCSSMRGYLDTLHSFNEYLKQGRLEVYKDEWREALPAQLPVMACTLAVEAHPRVKSALQGVEPDEYTSTLKGVREIFTGGSKDVFMGDYSRSIRHIIDKLLPPGETSSPIWPAHAEQYLANKIYVTDSRKNKPRINGEDYIYPLNAHGQFEAKVALLHTLPHIRLKLDSMRSALGFVREPMVQLQVSPVLLMMNVARSKDAGFPPLARAYLFDQCVEMLKFYEKSPASGLAFSPSLRADVEAFRAMKNTHSLRVGCWLEPHSVQSEQDWKRFFAGIDGHDYKREICATVDALLNAKLSYAGFIREDGMEVCLKSGVDESRLYRVDFQSGTPRCEPYRAGERSLPYTPLFVLER